MSKGILRLTGKWPEDAAVSALKDIYAVSRIMHRSACIRINQCFHNSFRTVMESFVNIRFHTVLLIFQEFGS
jgi:hypothetical protein